MNPVNFGGQFGYYKEYSGQYLLGHRYYNAALGRFLTRDPIGYGGGLNLYGYTGNNPVNRQDPNGTDDFVDGMQAYGVQMMNDFADPYVRRAWKSVQPLLKVFDQVASGPMGPGMQTCGDDVPCDVATANAPNLPPPLIYRRGNVRITHKYGGGLDAGPGGRSDHLPAHAHVEGGGRETHIGANGKPLRGQPDLTPEQERVVEAGRSVIRSRVNKINRWAKYLKWARRIPIE